MGVGTDFYTKGLAGHAFERSGVARRGPEFQLRVTRRSQLQQIVVAAIVELEARDGLRVAAIEALGEAQNRRERPHRAARATTQVAEPVVAALGRGLTMVTRDERNRLDFVGLEAAEVAVLDEVIRVVVVACVADVHPDVVQDRRVLEPLALAVGQAMNGSRVVAGRRLRLSLVTRDQAVQAFMGGEFLAA